MFLAAACSAVAWESPLEGAGIIDSLILCFTNSVIPGFIHSSIHSCIHCCSAVAWESPLGGTGIIDSLIPKSSGVHFLVTLEL